MPDSAFLRRLRIHELTAVFTIVLLGAIVAPAGAALVSNISVVHLKGQSFVTWTSPPGTGWLYYVYRADAPPGLLGGIDQYTELGIVRDSTWCDRRLSALRDTTYAFVVPGTGELRPDQGVFVHNIDGDGEGYYAVTCVKGGVPLDATIVPGVNATVEPTIERIDHPQPIFQRDVEVCYGQNRIVGKVYTLWVGNRDTPCAPAMCNKPSTPYDCAISVNAAGNSHSLMFHPHARGGNFMQLNWGSGMPGEFVLTMDDHIGTPDLNTFWFGFVETYNIYGVNMDASLGAVVDYTFRRMVYTLEWARATLPYDNSKTFMMGSSMGGIAGMLLSLTRPDLIAATMLNVPLFDLGYQTDPNPVAGFNYGMPQRLTCNRLFGAVESHMTMLDGTPAFDRMNANKLVSKWHGEVPPMIAFSGRNDTTLGWAEKPIYYETVRRERAGGTFFFDTRTHGGTNTSMWGTMMDFQYLYRYRTDRSFPAFSNCCADQNPGDGNPLFGDSVGTINGYADWNPILVDTPELWSVHLGTRDLNGRFQLYSAPEPFTVDVTPRRTQQFKLLPFQPVRYTLTSDFDGELMQEGIAYADNYGTVTVPNVTIRRSGVTLSLVPIVAAGVGDGGRSRSGLALEGVPNPLRGSVDFEVRLPRSGAVEVGLFDVAGRRVRPIYSGAATAGTQRLRLDSAGLSAGLYLLRAAQGDDVVTRRLVLTP